MSRQRQKSPNAAYYQAVLNNSKHMFKHSKFPVTVIPNNQLLKIYALSELFDTPKYKGGFELNIEGCCVPGYINFMETYDKDAQRYISYCYKLCLPDMTYICSNQEKKSGEIEYSIRFEVHSRKDKSPHVHVLHPLPKWVGDSSMNLIKFIDWVDEKFFDNEAFISTPPWERRSTGE